MSDRNIVYRVNSLFRKLEKIGLITKTPNFVYNYTDEYPELQILEDNYEIVRKGM